MPVPPGTLPIWATAPLPGSLVVPPAAKQALGWVVEIPPHETYNWWQNLTFQWVEHYSLTIGVEHDINDGTHSDITADTLDVSGDVGLGSFAPLGPTDFTFRIDDSTGEVQMRDPSGGLFFRWNPTGDIFTLLSTAGNPIVRIERAGHLWTLQDSNGDISANMSDAHIFRTFDTGAGTVFEVDSDLTTPRTRVIQGTLEVVETVQEFRSWAGADFTPRFRDMAADTLENAGVGGVEVRIASVIGVLNKTIELPNGVQLTDLDLFMNIPADTTWDCRVNLRRVTKETGSGAILATATYPNAGTGNVTATDSFTHTVDNAANYYFLELIIDEVTSVGPASGQARGVQITYNTNVVHG